MGLGAIVRDYDGKMARTAVKHIEANWSILVAESKAICLGLELAE